MADRDPVIGIDLGTTNTVVATVQGGQPVVIKNRGGQHLTPSMVAITKTGKYLAGQLAKRQAITNPEETVYAAKRLIGRKFQSDEVQEAMKTLPYKIVAGAHDDVRVELGGRAVSLPELSAMVLKEAKADAEAYFGVPVSKAVITVPAYFNDGQRQATKDAGRIAGLDVLRILNEPTAAALAYGFGKSLTGKIAVFDLGGGTFDISILELSQGIFDVIATGGDTYLGGEDFDNRVIEHLAFGFAKEHGVDLRKDRMALQRLKEAAEKAKIELSTIKEAQINLPFISTPSGGGAALHLQRPLPREKFEELTADLVSKAISVCGQVLEEAKVKPMDLKEVVLVGGMTRVPKVVEAVKAFFGREPSKGVHPEEVVALGAAVQGNALTDDKATVLLLDVTPQSLGVAVAGGYVRRLIPKNTTVPTSMKETFNTSRDQQTSVNIFVLQGENELAHNNELLGEFVLSGLRPARRGEIGVEVSFEINSEGLLAVSAVDKETGKAQSITVSASSGLTHGELEQILQGQAGGALPSDGAAVERQEKELEELIAQVERSLPKAEQLTDGSDFGSEALQRAREHVTSGKRALIARDLGAMTSSAAQLGRTLTLLEGVIQRLGSLAS